MYDFKGKTILITGATGKLAGDIIAELAKRNVVFALQYHQNESRANELKNILNSLRITHRLYPLDLLCPKNPMQLAQKVLSDFGKVDILINSASRFRFADIKQTDDALLNEMLALNIAVPFQLARELADNFFNIEGAIVNIADIWGIRPKANFIAYSISKAGLIGLTKALAETFAPRTTVNAIAPGIIDFPKYMDEDRQKEITSRIPLLRKGTSAEIARTVIHIIQNRYLTGQTIVVDGGRLL